MSSHRRTTRRLIVLCLGCAFALPAMAQPVPAQPRATPQATVPTFGAPPPDTPPVVASPPSLIPPEAIPPEAAALAPLTPPTVESAPPRLPTATSLPAQVNRADQAVPEARGMTFAYPEPSKDAVLLGEIRRQITITRAQGELLQANVDNRDLRKVLGSSDGTNTGMPSLIGIYGAGGNMTAEFLVGKSLLTAHPGDWVNSEWRLRRVLANGAELRNKAGAKKTVLLGSAAVAPAAQSRPSNTTSRASNQVPPQGPPYELDAVHSSR